MAGLRVACLWTAVILSCVWTVRGELSLKPGSDKGNVSTTPRHFVDETPGGTGCKCVHKTYDCGCCVHLKIGEIHLDDTVCLNLTYLVHDYGISISFSIDGRIIFKETISARNPPPICFGIPDLKKDASICLDFYNMDISSADFSGCVRLEVEFLHIKLAQADLGCFRIPLSKQLDKLQNILEKDTFRFKNKTRALLDLLNKIHANKLKG